MKLIYHIIIMAILFFTIPELFCLSLIYWSLKIGFTLLCIIVKPLIKLGLINPNSTNQITPNSTESWTQKNNRLEKERRHREYLNQQSEINSAKAILNDTINQF